MARVISPAKDDGDSKDAVTTQRLSSELAAVPRLRVAGAHAKEKLRNMWIDCQNYAYEHGVDKPEIDQWTWP